MSIALSLRNVSKSYSTGGHTFKALDGVDLDIEAGKLVVILGPSGAGKSTLLNLIGGMDTPSEGTIKAEGTDISGYSENELADYRAANVGFIFQFYNILPTLTVLENVSLVADLTKDALDAASALKAVGLEEHMNKFPNQPYRADTIYSGELLDVTDVPEGVDVIQTKEGLETGVRGMMDRMTSIIALFIVLSAVLSVVILYNLGILSFTEKQYQFATLKVLGYRTGPLRRIFNQQGRILSIISIILGLPAGYFMISYIFSEALGDNYDFSAYVRPISYVLAGAAIFLVSCLVNGWLAGKIRKIDMVSSLKANE